MRFWVVLLASAVVRGHNYSDINSLSPYERQGTLHKHVDCFLDRAPCDDVAAHYKKHILEGLSDGCQECSDTLKHTVHVFLRDLRDQFPEDFLVFQKKYDPEEKTIRYMESRINSY